MPEAQIMYREVETDASGGRSEAAARDITLARRDLARALVDPLRELIADAYKQVLKLPRSGEPTVEQVTAMPIAMDAGTSSNIPALKFVVTPGHSRQMEKAQEEFRRIVAGGISALLRDDRFLDLRKAAQVELQDFFDLDVNLIVQGGGRSVRIDGKVLATWGNAKDQTAVDQAHGLGRRGRLPPAPPRHAGPLGGGRR